MPDGGDVLGTGQAKKEVVEVEERAHEMHDVRIDVHDRSRVVGVPSIACGFASTPGRGTFP